MTLFTVVKVSTNRSMGKKVERNLTFFRFPFLKNLSKSAMRKNAHILIPMFSETKIYLVDRTLLLNEH